MPGRKKPGPHAADRTAEDFRAPGDSPGSYDEWTVADLRRRARQLGLTGYAGKKKTTLIAMLRDH